MLFLLFSLIGKAQTSDSLIVNQMKAVGINFYPDNEVRLIMSGKDKLLAAQQNKLQSKYQTILAQQMLKFYAGQ